MTRIMSESLVELRNENGVFVAKVTAASLDTILGAELTDQLKALVPRIGSGPAVLDLSGVHFMQTQGLRAALLIYKAVKAAGGRVCICISNVQVRGMFATTKLDSVLEIHPDMTAAMSAMRPE